MAASASPKGPPKWRFFFFAALIVLLILGSKPLGIPHELSVPLGVASLLALANGELPKWDIPDWFKRGKGKDDE